MFGSLIPVRFATIRRVRSCSGACVKQDSVANSATREAPEDVEAVEAPTSPIPEIAMESTVGAPGVDYVTTSRGDGTVPVARGSGGERGGGGPGRGEAGPLANQGGDDVVVSPDWEITEMPEPLNDRDFEPAYPALAKREGREAVVVLQLYIDGSGKVTKVEVVEGPGGHGFEAAARDYAAKLRFRPARAGQRQVAARIEWSVHFYVRN
jgi:protein TonB